MSSEEAKMDTSEIEEPKEKITPERQAFMDGLVEAEGKAKTLANSGKLAEALEVLLLHEKKTRLAGDAYSTADVAVAIVNLAWEKQDLEALNAHILILSKRRAQLKHAVTKMVQRCMDFLDGFKDKVAKEAFVTTMRTVTDGKIYVEVERARLTMTLAHMFEEDGKVEEASETLQQIAVETFTGMEKREKAEFLLEQVRLCLAQRDYIRMQITANKMSKSILNEDGFEDIKLKHYNLMLELHAHKKDPKLLCADWQAIYNTKGVKDDKAQWVPALQSVVVYLAVTPFDHEVHDLEHRLLADPNMEELPAYKRLLEALTTHEIIPWPTPDTDELKTHPVLAEAEWYALFRKAIVQHNIRVIAKYYSRIRFARICQLLGLDADEAEGFISELVSDKALYAKIDRPAGVVVFHRAKTPTDVLTDWSGDVSKLLGLVEQTCHLINKENMVHGVKA